MPVLRRFEVQVSINNFLNDLIRQFFLQYKSFRIYFTNNNEFTNFNIFFKCQKLSHMSYIMHLLYPIIVGTTAYTIRESYLISTSMYCIFIK